MMTMYRTDNRVLHEVEEIEEGVWINLTNPTMEESQEIAEYFDMDIVDVRAALDEEESSRIELEDGYTLILVDIPATEIRHEAKNYTTIPLGHPADAGMYCYGMYRGDTDSAAFYSAAGPGVFHKEKNAFCLSDTVPYLGDVSEYTSHY